MTALNFFAIAANGTQMGVFKATDADAAVLAYAQDAGFKNVEAAAAALGVSVEDFRADLAVEHLQETYEYVLDDIRELAATESDNNEKTLNIRRAELAEVAQQLADGGHDVDYTADLEAALAGSHYRDTVYQETSIILSVTDIKDLGLLAAA